MRESHNILPRMTATHLETKFEIKSWDEETLQDLPDGQRLARAIVALAATGPDLDAAATMTMLLHYLADGTSTYVALLSVEGRLGGRPGSFVLHGTGGYDGTEARSEHTVVPGSGTGELAGLRGSGGSVSTHSDYPYLPFTLSYEHPAG